MTARTTASMIKSFMENYGSAELFLGDRHVRLLRTGYTTYESVDTDGVITKAWRQDQKKCTSHGSRIAEGSSDIIAKIDRFIKDRRRVLFLKEGDRYTIRITESLTNQDIIYEYKHESYLELLRHFNEFASSKTQTV